MAKEEIIILKSQATIKNRLTWRMGQLFLTGNRILFVQMTNKLFEVNLDGVIEISIFKRAWLLGCKVKQLCIAYQGQKEEEYVYIALADPEKWVHNIKKAITLRLIERWNYNGTKQESPNDS
jgi:hypothetical protein